MDAPFHLKCLGPPALIAPDGDVVRFRTRKHLALLVYLGAEPRVAHRRDRLADLLWSSAPAGEARHSLATALSIIRSKLGHDALDCSRDQVRLVAASVTTDLARLAAGDIFGDDGGGMLDVAGFLEGFEVADAIEFMLWKDRQQARWLPAIQDALVRLMDRCRRTGDFTRIEQAADRMLVLDELSEEAVRAKMEARAFAGDRLTALRVFEAWKEDLARELGASPSPLVEGMAIRLRRRGWERTTPSRIPNVPTDHWKDQVFIGRGREYRVLYEGWERLQRGEVGHALVAGDSGIGKSTLVERFTTAAALEGAAVTRVQCYEPDRGIPYGAIGLLIPPLLDRPGASATPPEALAELARTVPEVRRRYPTVPEAPDSQGETARLRLAEAFHELLRAVAEEHPVIAVVDDLHHCDDVSLAVLHLVIRKAKGEPILIVFTVRPGELVQSPQAQHLLERAESIGVVRVDLPPLSEEESEQAITAMAGADGPQPSAAVRRSIVRAAAGYPMVLELLVRDWETSGEQCLAVSVGAMTAELAAAGGALPAFAYRAVLERLIRSLGPTGRNVANLAAILGHRLNDLAMYALVDLTIGQTMTGFAELVERRVLRDGGQRLEFVNELVRAHVYVGVPSPLRKALHGQIADRLIEQEARGESVPGLETAWHCMRAHRVEEATPYLLRGAREALHTGAAHEAELALSSGLGELSGAPRLQAATLLADVLQEEGRWEASLDLLYREFGVAMGASEEILVLTARHYLRRETLSDTRESALRLMNLASDSRAKSTQVRAARAATPLLVELRATDLMAKLLETVATISEQGLAADDLEKLVLTRAQLMYHTRRREASQRELEIHLELAEARGIANATIAKMCIGAGALACARGAYAAAHERYKRALSIALRIGNETLVAQAAAQLALCAFRTGEYEQVSEWAARANEAFGTEFSGYNEIQVAYYTGFTATIRGHEDGAREAIAHLDQRLPNGIAPWMQQAWGLYRCDLLYLSRQYSAAVKCARSVIEDWGVEPHDLAFAGPTARWLGHLLSKDSSQPHLRDALASLLERIGDLDAIDRVEVVAAGSHAKLRLPHLERLICELPTWVKTLPRPVPTQLAKLGMPISPLS